MRAKKGKVYERLHKENMLKPISIKEIYNQVEYHKQIAMDYDAIESVDINTEHAIENIIINHINIQIGLGMLFPYRYFKNDTTFRENIGFLENKPVDEQIKDIQSIFSNGLLIKRDGKPSMLQVSKPIDRVFHLFLQLSTQGKLNKWVSYFLLRKPKNDISKVSGYEYILDNPSIGISSYENQLIDDEFFKYFRFNKRNTISHTCMPVTGFTLDDINSDPCIRAFSKTVKKLYVYTVEGVVPTKYDKFITWVEK